MTDEVLEERKGRIRGILAVAAVFGVSIASVVGGEIYGVDETESAPALALKDTAGRAVRLNDGGLPTILLFTSDDCETCPGSAAAVERSAQRWAGKVAFVVVHDGSQPPDTPSARVAIDEGASASRSYSVTNKPTVVLVTASGDVLGKRAGNLESGTLERQIRAVIAEGPARSS